MVNKQIVAVGLRNHVAHQLCRWVHGGLQKVDNYRVEAILESRIPFEGLLRDRQKKRRSVR